MIGSDEAVEGERPDVRLCVAEEAAAPIPGDVPLVRLRASVAASGPDDDSIYRYDRGALLEALRVRVAGGGL